MLTDNEIKTVHTIIEFLQSIGIPITFAPCDEGIVLPGIKIDRGSLIIDMETLLYPGDILHEAGHIAVVPPDERLAMEGTIDPKRDMELSGELMAIPWSYAACIHLGLDPSIVFHDNGYKGGGQYLIENFQNGRYIGVPMLQYIGLCYEPRKTKHHGEPEFPMMLKWLRE